MKIDPLRFETVVTIARFESLRAKWDDLWMRAEGSFAQAFPYCINTLREIAAPAGANLHCIIGWQGERMVLAWPLIRFRELLWRAVRPLAPDGSVFTDILVEEGPRQSELLEAAWRALPSAVTADLLILPRIRSESSLFLFASKCSGIGRAELQKTAVVFPRGEWEDFRALLPSRARKELDGYKRRIAKEGEISINVADLALDSGLGLIDELFAWKRQWAEKGAKDGAFFSPEYRNFLLGLLRDTATTGQFRLFVLSLNDKAIAVNLVAVEKSTVHGMQAAFDSEYGKFTPGALLLEHVVKWAFESGRVFDFGAGGGKYKTVWAGDASYDSTEFRIATSPWGKLAFALADLRRWYRAYATNIGSKRRCVPGEQMRSELEP